MYKVTIKYQDGDYKLLELNYECKQDAFDIIKNVLLGDAKTKYECAIAVVAEEEAINAVD